MRLKVGTSRKLRYGGITAALTAAIIAVVILVNVMFSALADKFMWYTDLTPELSFTLTDNFIELIAEGDDSFENSGSPIEKLNAYREERKKDDPDFDPSSLKINIIFCNDKLTWSKENSYRMHIWKMVEDLSLAFPNDFSIEYVDIIRNPSRVDQYKKDGSKISTDSVIIEFGEEYRVRSLRSFYMFDDETSSTPWAFNGEKILASAIMAVTRSDTPIACFTSNHGETVPEEGALIETIENAGFKVQKLDLMNEPIPEACRLIIISNPTLDFTVADGRTEKDETQMLDDFLDGTSAVMAFISPTQHNLVNLEGFLAEWGIAFRRDNYGNPHIVEDRLHSIDEYGYNITAEYPEAGFGADIVKELAALNRKIIFPYAMAMGFGPDVQEPTGGVEDGEDGVAYKYGIVKGDGYYREIYDLFLSSDDAVAMAGGSEVATAKDGNNFKLMTVSVEDHYTQDSNYSGVNNSSYVFATGCPDFIADDMLKGQYGNNMFIEFLLRKVAREPVPVGLTFNPFGDSSIDTIEVADAITYTIVLTVVPLIISTGVGIFVIVRRKYR